MDLMINDLYEAIKIKKYLTRERIYIFVVGIISGLIAHIYYMVNRIASDDMAVISYSEDPYNVIEYVIRGSATGRWLGSVVDLVMTWYRSFYVAGWITIVLMALISLFLISCFNIKSKTGMVLTTVLIEISPVTQGYVVLGEISYVIASLFAVISAWLIIKRRGVLSTWIRAFIFLGLALVIMPTNMSCMITTILLWAISELAYSKENSADDIIKLILKAFVVLVMAGAFLLLSSVLIMKIGNVSSTGYQGAEQAVSGSFLTQLPLNLFQVYKKFIVQGLWKIQIVPVLRITYYLAYIIDLILILVLWSQSKKDNVSSSGKRAVLIGIGLVLVPVAVCTITVISYGFMYRGQHRFPLMILIIGGIMLTEKVSMLYGSAIKQKSKRIWNVCIIAIINSVLMIYGFFLYDNIGYQMQHYVMEHDSALCIRILSALDANEDFEYSDPIYFLNITTWDENEAVTDAKYEPELYSVIWPVVTTNLYCYGDISIRRHMTNYEGVDFISPSEEIQNEIEDSELVEQYDDLKAWDFAITTYKGVTVVVVKTVMPPNVLYG
ncbi:glucosyltransferase domain-containing protein [Butyrivibrio fibrisolvens]|uniref:glucosyltransferase domain-containing protein n=1 Tax=Butyrivibrio fibrisolvens TaxID=831 RepID=UPI00040F813D|nr:glucosyltransferase domain-containing protein [Butyrivibrio fibrisolvens]